MTKFSELFTFILEGTGKQMTITFRLVMRMDQGYAYESNAHLVRNRTYEISKLQPYPKYCRVKMYGNCLTTSTYCIFTLLLILLSTQV